MNRDLLLNAISGVTFLIKCVYCDKLFKETEMAEIKHLHGVCISCAETERREE